MSVTCVSLFLFVFFKQKTAYEVRISDWSSDVCSSDLMPGCLPRAGIGRHQGIRVTLALCPIPRRSPSVLPSSSSPSPAHCRATPNRSPLLRSWPLLACSVLRLKPRGCSSLAPPWPISKYASAPLAAIVSCLLLSAGPASCAHVPQPH